MDTRSAQLVFHFFIEELAVSHEATLRNCCVTRPDPFGIPGPLGPSALVCSGLPRFCPLVSGERLSPSSAFLQANGQCPGAAPASVKEPCEPGFQAALRRPVPSSPPDGAPTIRRLRVLYTIRRPPRNCAPCRLSPPTTCCPRINTNLTNLNQFVDIRGHSFEVPRDPHDIPTPSVSAHHKMRILCGTLFCLFTNSITNSNPCESMESVVLRPSPLQIENSSERRSVFVSRRRP